MHPRLKHYPHHEDYLNHANEYRPFVMTMGEPNYRSKSLNTDEFGFRIQYFHEGEAIELTELKRRAAECNLLLGGSTVFGVTATGDEKTISSYLTRPGVPCINWGVRGATNQQELILYLSLKYLLPQPRNIVLLTGVNDVSLAAMRGALRYPAFGGVFSHDFFYRKYRHSEPLRDSQHDVLELKRLHQHLDTLWTRSPRFQQVVRLLYRNHEPYVGADPATLPLADQFPVVCAIVANTIETWGLIQAASGVRVHYVLQPSIGWSRKPLTEVERECFDEDLRTIESVKLFTDYALYERFRDHVKSACAAASIRFYDANEWLEQPQYSSQDLFTDSCHFNDRGYQMIADLLQQRLSWR